MALTPRAEASTGVCDRGLSTVCCLRAVVCRSPCIGSCCVFLWFELLSRLSACVVCCAQATSVRRLCPPLFASTPTTKSPLTVIALFFFCLSFVYVCWLTLLCVAVDYVAASQTWVIYAKNLASGQDTTLRITRQQVHNVDFKVAMVCFPPSSFPLLASFLCLSSLSCV